MNNTNISPYKAALTDAMTNLALQSNTIFIGQQIVYAGNPMSTTLVNVPKHKMVEVPVMEETQMGMSLGLSMTGKTVISFYPRWNFLICAANQLINHLDTYHEMTDKHAHVLIRVGKGADVPLDPGPQHKANFFEAFRLMCKNTNFYNLETAEQVTEAYEQAQRTPGIHVLAEYPEFYNS